MRTSLWPLSYGQARLYEDPGFWGVANNVVGPRTESFVPGALPFFQSYGLESLTPPDIACAVPRERACIQSRRRRTPHLAGVRRFLVLCTDQTKCWSRAAPITIRIVQDGFYQQRVAPSTRHPVLLES